MLIEIVKMLIGLKCSMQALFIEISFLPDVGTCPLTLSLIYSLSLSLSHIVDNPFIKKKVITSLKKEEKIQRGKKHTAVC